jgi:hypothetical protein
LIVIDISSSSKGITSVKVSKQKKHTFFFKTSQKTVTVRITAIPIRIQIVLPLSFLKTIEFETVNLATRHAVFNERMEVDYEKC